MDGWMDGLRTLRGGGEVEDLVWGGGKGGRGKCWVMD